MRHPRQRASLRARVNPYIAEQVQGVGAVAAARRAPRSAPAPMVRGRRALGDDPNMHDCVLPDGQVRRADGRIEKVNPREAALLQACSPTGGKLIRGAIGVRNLTTAVLATGPDTIGPYQPPPTPPPSNSGDSMTTFPGSQPQPDNSGNGSTNSTNTKPPITGGGAADPRRPPSRGGRPRPWPRPHGRPSSSPPPAPAPAPADTTVSVSAPNVVVNVPTAPPVTTAPTLPVVDELVVSPEPKKVPWLVIGAIALSAVALWKSSRRP